MNRSHNSSGTVTLLGRGGILAYAVLVLCCFFILKQAPVTKFIADEGNFIFSFVFELYFSMGMLLSFAVVYGAGGIIYEKKRQNMVTKSENMFRAFSVFTAVMGIAVAGLLFFEAEYICNSFLRVPHAFISLRIISAAVVPLTLCALFRLYFVSNGIHVPVAISFAAEGIALILVMYPAISLFGNYGKKVSELLQNKIHYNSFCIAGCCVGIIISLAVVILLMLFFLFAVSVSHRNRQPDSDTFNRRKRESDVVLYLSAVYQVLVLYLIGISVHGFILADQLIYIFVQKDRIQLSSLMQQWGSYYSKYALIRMFPICLAVSASIGFVYRLRNMLKKEAFATIKHCVSDHIRLMLMLVVPVSVFLGAAASVIVEGLYYSTADSLGVDLLHMGFATGIMLSVGAVCIFTLTALRKTRMAACIMLICLLLHMGTTYVMLQFMNLDIMSVLVADIVYSAVFCLATTAVTKRQLHIGQSIIRYNIDVFVAAAVMGIVIFIISVAMNSLIPAKLFLIVLAVIAYFIYYIILLLMRYVSEKELSALPLGFIIVFLGRLCGVL